MVTIKPTEVANFRTELGSYYEHCQVFSSLRKEVAFLSCCEFCLCFEFETPLAMLRKKDKGEKLRGLVRVFPHHRRDCGSCQSEWTKAEYSTKRREGISCLCDLEITKQKLKLRSQSECLQMPSEGIHTTKCIR